MKETLKDIAAITIFIIIPFLVIMYFAAGRMRESIRITEYCRAEGYLEYKMTGARMGPAGPARAYCLGVGTDGSLITTEVPDDLIGLNPFK